MNHIYNIIWNRVKEGYMVVSEKTGQSRSRRSRRNKTLIVSGVAFCCALVLTGLGTDVLAEGGTPPTPAVEAGTYVGINNKEMEPAYDGIKNGRHSHYIPKNHNKNGEGALPNSLDPNNYGAIAIGYDAYVSHGLSTAVGYDAYAVEDSLAIGSAAYAVNNSVGLGVNAWSSGEAIAIGRDSRSSGIAIGNEAQAGYFYKYADEMGSYASMAIAIGKKAIASGGMAIGNNSSSDFYGTAIGHDSRAGYNGTAIGYGALNYSDRGVALGMGSVANRQGNIYGYFPDEDYKSTKVLLKKLGKEEEFKKLTEIVAPYKEEWERLNNEFNEIEHNEHLAELKMYETKGKDNAAFEAAKKEYKAWSDLNVENTKKRSQFSKDHPEFEAAYDELNTFFPAYRSSLGAVSVGTPGYMNRYTNRYVAAVTRQIINVAPGTIDTDAVNVAQLKTIDHKFERQPVQYTDKKGELLKKVEDTFIPMDTRLGSDGKAYRGIAIEGSDGKYYSTKVIIDGGKAYPQDSVKGADNVYYVGGTPFDEKGMPIDPQKAEKAKEEKPLEGIAPVPVNEVSVSLISTGKDNVPLVLHHVAPGVADTDAVNVKQLHDSIKNMTGGTAPSGKPLTIQANTGNRVTSLGETLSLIGGQGKATEGLVTKGYSDQNTATEVKDGKVHLLFAEKPEFKEITVQDGKGQKTVIRKDGISLEGPAGKEGTPGKSVTLTVDKDGQLIKDTGDATTSGVLLTDKDAKELVNSAQGNVKDVEKQVKSIGAKVDSLGDEVHNTAAMGAALSALKPIQYNPNARTQIMSGAGYYKHSLAVALGVSHYTNEKMMLHAGFAYGAQSGDVAINAGATWAIGSGKDKSYTPHTYVQGHPIDNGLITEKEVKDMKDTIAILLKKVDALEKELKHTKK